MAALDGVTLFRMTPKERIQLVLGTNGSGKSSLMRELTPLPALSEHYEKTGHKKIVISHKGHMYNLESYFSPQQHHRFEKDGVNLNAELGTLAVQRELVKQEFGITQELHDIMTGEEKFTRMPPNMRRHLFTKLSETDLTFAIQTYNKLREKHRDILGALKLAKKQLVHEATKKVSEEDVLRLRSSIDAMVEKLNALYALRNDEKRLPDEIHLEQSDLLSDIQKSCRQFIVQSRYFKGKKIQSPEDIQQQIQQEREELAAAQAVYASLGEEHARLHETYTAYSKTGAVGISELLKGKSEKEQQRYHLVRQKIFISSFQNAQEASTALASCYETLTHCFSELPKNENKQYSQIRLQELQIQEKNIKEKIQVLDKKATELRHHKSHMEAIEKNDAHVVCPKCSHSWLPGYSEKKLQQYTQDLERVVSELEAENKKLKDLSENIESVYQYGELFRSYSRCVKMYPSLNPLWDHLQETQMVYLNPRQVLFQIEAARQQIQIDQDIARIDKEIREQNDLLALAQKAKEIDIGRVKTRLEEVEERMGILASDLRQRSQKITELTQDKSRLEELLKIAQSIQNSQDCFDRGLMDLARSLSNEAVNELLKSIQLQLSEKQRALNDIQMHQGIIDNLQKTVDDLTKQERVYHHLSSELSPTEGLIAESLLGFIRVFVSKMNQLIQKSWAYRMEIQDCSTEADSADLDYKFPIKIGNNETPAKDVSKTSTGQEEMINLAFRIVAMMYAGLSDSWLILDEFGSAMDENHREKAVTMIKTLLEQLPFSQMFMVSHYAGQYMAFQNAEICVLNDLGITVPKEYNQCVVIE